VIDLVPSSTKATITELAPYKTRNLASYINIIEREREEDNKLCTKTLSHIIHTALKEVPSIVPLITHQCNPFHKHLMTFDL